MNKNIIKWSLCGIAGLLAVMGLCFVWHSPIDWIYIGLCLAAMTIPWHRWQKLAPLGIAVWVALSIVAVVFALMNINLVPVLAWTLFSGWLCVKGYVRLWMFIILIGSLLICVSLLVLGNPNRMSRLCEAFGLKGGTPASCSCENGDAL